MNFLPIIHKKKPSLKLDDFFMSELSKRSRSHPTIFPDSPLENDFNLYPSIQTQKQGLSPRSPKLFLSLKNVEIDPVVMDPTAITEKNNKINDKYFKIIQRDHEQTNKNLNLSPKKQYGKMVNAQMIKEIYQKETMIFKKESKKHRLQQSLDLSNFKSNVFIRDFISKCQPKEKKNPMIEKNCCPLFNEDTFNKFIKHFYQRKMLKSPSLMKYFQGKNTDVIINNIGKFIFVNSFSPKEQNLASFEYLANVHSSLNIENQDFDTYKGLFLISMRDNVFQENEVQKFCSKIENYRSYIVKPLKFEQISCKKESFQDFLINFHGKIKKNGMLAHLFSNITNEEAITKHKKLFNNVCMGYDSLNLHKKKNELIEIILEKQDFSWQQCHEMKTVIRNELLDGKTLNFNDEFNLFDHQLHNLHKFILNEPNPYQLDLNLTIIDPKLLINLLFQAITRQKSLKKLFDSWSVDRMQDHCKYIVEYILNSPLNPYKSCDMAPAHSGSFITRKEFNIILECFYACLIKMKCKNDEINKLMVNFESIRHFISREKHLCEKIPNFQHCVEHYIDVLYVHMFGNQNTKHFFKNSDLDYVKYKQKLFFLKLFRNEIDDVDLTDLKAIHWKMGIKPQHFELFSKSTYDSLTETQINPEYVGIFMEKINGLKEYICSENK